MMNESLTNYSFHITQPLEADVRQEFTANQSHQKNSYFGYKSHEITLRPEAPEFIPSWLKKAIHSSNSNLAEGDCQCGQTFTPNFQDNNILKNSQLKEGSINESELIQKSSLFDLNKVVDTPAFEPIKDVNIVEQYQDFNNKNNIDFYTDKSDYHQNRSECVNGTEAPIVEPKLRNVKYQDYWQNPRRFDNRNTINSRIPRANTSQNDNEYKTRKTIDGNIGYESSEIVHSNQSPEIESPNSTSRHSRNDHSQEYEKEVVGRRPKFKDVKCNKPSSREQIVSGTTGSNYYENKQNRQVSEFIPSEINNPYRVEHNRCTSVKYIHSLQEYPLGDVNTCGVSVESKTLNQASIENNEKEVIEDRTDKIIKNDDSHENIHKSLRENSKHMRHNKNEVYPSKSYTRNVRDKKDKNFNIVIDECEVDRNAEKISQGKFNYELVEQRFKNQHHGHTQNRTAIRGYNKETVNETESTRIDKGIESRHSFREKRDYEKNSTGVFLFTGRRSNDKPRDIKKERGYQKTEKSNEFSSVAHMFDKNYAEEDVEYKHAEEDDEYKQLFISEYNNETVNADTSTNHSEFGESTRIDKRRTRHSFREKRDYEKSSTDVLFTGRRSNDKLTGRRSNEKPRDLKQERGYQKSEISNEVTSIAHMFDKKYAEEDNEYKQFLDELHSKTTPDFSKIQEENRDLFDMPEDWSLAHCVAEDLRMGSGIAVMFRNSFGMVDVLLNQRQMPGGLAFLKINKRYIFYLITKKKSSDKPTYKDFWCSMKNLRDTIKRFEVVKLAVPTLGCGLDRLDWSTVKHMISFLFKDIPINIVVCKFRQSEEEPLNYRSVKVRYIKDSICNTTESVLLYFTTESSHISEEMIELDKKLNFLQHLRSAPKRFGGCVMCTAQNIILCGCVVRQKVNDRFNFISFKRSLELVKEQVKDNIAIEYITDENDNLLCAKVVTILLNTFKDIAVNIYKGNCDGSFGEL
ncbi:unnamed protein product [Diabrotica balteata]|uniref:Macro domain-containing protein n=1 Tax=Diabrotica balteata TaxID=107213 RepID=A0A9N9T092_DIABA|nr:unnamed protein product [Diabrotica balteata]